MSMIHSGTLVYAKNQESGINIALILSSSPGFGTQSYKNVMQSYVDKGMTGPIDATAIFSSHLFHLYMGMIPLDNPICPIDALWPEGREIVNYDLSTIKVAISNPNPSPYLLSKTEILKQMIYYAHNKELNEEKAAVISSEEVMKCEDAITKLEREKISYIKEAFIPKLLKCLAKDPTSRQPSTYDIGSTSIVMSKEGMERWKKALVEKSDFTPFKRLEQLHPHMSEEQLDQLNELLDIRERAIDNQKSKRLKLNQDD